MIRRPSFSPKSSGPCYERMLGLVFKVCAANGNIELTYLPVRIPRPRGLYATTGIPNSCAAENKPTDLASESSVNGEYSICRAAMGCTAFARRRVSAEHSDIPIYLTFPDLRGWDQRKSQRERSRHPLHGLCHGLYRELWAISVVEQTGRECRTSIGTVASGLNRHWSWPKTLK